jgi:phage-related minor tail protein
VYILLNCMGLGIFRKIGDGVKTVFNKLRPILGMFGGMNAGLGKFKPALDKGLGIVDGIFNVKSKATASGG